MATGLLGKKMSVANADAIVYTVPQGIQFTNLNINIVNTGSTDSKVRVCVSTAAASSAADAIEWDNKIPANGGVLERTCILASPGENIIIFADSSNLAVRVSGLEQS